MYACISHHLGRPNSERRENVRQPTVAVIIEVLWVAHGRLPPEMNQHLRVPLRQCYELILGGGDSPDPFSIPRWNSTQETPRGSDYGLIVEETESRAERRTTHVRGTSNATARSPSPGDIPMLSDPSLAAILFQKQPAKLWRYPEDPEPTACAVPSSTKTKRWYKGQWDWKQLEGKNHPNLASHCGKPG